jgi:signal transduction histidine kinase
VHAHRVDGLLDHLLERRRDVDDGARLVVADVDGGGLEDLRDHLGDYGGEVEVVVERAPKIDPVRTEALLRIAAEAVTNAAKHAHGGAIIVMLDRHRGRPRLRVTDRGGGFRVAETTQEATSGFGLTSMRQRARSVGAHLRIDTGSGGTTVEVTF